jgi:uncharacterized protein DUF6325
MGIAPVDYLAVAFPGNKFSGAILPEIKKLVDAGTIRVLDLVIITKDEAGNIAAIEASEASPELAASLAALGIEGKNLLGQDDFEDIGEALEPNSTCGLMVWENVWAADFAKSLRDADGILLGQGRIPAAYLEELLAEGVA